jgi:hypothetical protein
MELKDIKLTPLLDTLRLEKISDKVYFSEKYSNYVSNSRLGLLNPRQDGNPDKFFSGLKFTTSQALALGSAVHELVLQPDSFELSEDVGKPTAKLGVMADELYPIFVERDVTKDDVVKASDKVDYYKGKITKDRANDVISECSNYWTKRKERELDITQDREIIYLDNKSLEIVKSCVSALNSNKQVQNLLHPKGLLQDPISENEQAILLDVKAECPNGSEFILHLKSKLDNYTIDLETNTIVVNDIKTIGKIVSEIDNNIKKFHYSREFAMYIYLLKLCAEKFYGLVNPKISANYLVVSTIPNFFTKVRPVTYGEIREGFHEFRTLLKYAAYNIGYNNYSLDERPSKYQL